MVRGKDGRGLRYANGQERNRDGWDRGGLNTATELCVAKNVVCVGAMQDVELSTPITVESYSGWGPTDDGRIKPDLVADGRNIVSTSNTDDEAVYHDTGTSMASPTAAGIAALLVQLYRDRRGGEPFASIIKAVMIHTARDAGEPGAEKPGEPGPDPVFGWGSIDALRAGRVIARPNSHLIRHVSVSDSEPVWRLRLQPNGDPIKVTMVWTDPPAESLRAALDDPTPVLVNDIDVKLMAPDGQPYFPYSLDRANPHQPATRLGPNRVDNVEVIEGAGSLPGAWTVEVSINRQQWTGPRQDFAVVISGLR